MKTVAVVMILTLGGAVAEASEPEERLKAAEMLLMEGQHARAEPLFRAVYEETQSAQAAYFLSVICVLTGRPGEGEQLLRHAVASDPTNDRAWKALGLLYEEQSRYEQAAEAFRRHLDLLPANEQARLLLAKVLVRDGRHEEAGPILQELAASDSQSSEAQEGRIELGLMYIEQAQQLYRDGQYPDSLEKLKGAAQLLPPSPELHEFLGRAYLATGDPAALEHLRRAAEGESREEAWDAYGGALVRFGRLDEAVSFFQSKVAQEPEGPGFRILLGAALWDKTDYEAALEQYEIAAKLAPSSPRAHFLRGSGYMLLGEDAKAKIAFERCLQIDGQFQPALSALGSLLASEGGWHEAAAQLRKARELAPESLSVRLELGRVYQRLQRYEEALEELQTAQRLAPHEKRVYYLMGRAYSELGKPMEAKKAYEQFASLEDEELRRKATAGPYLSPGLLGVSEDPEASRVKDRTGK